MEKKAEKKAKKRITGTTIGLIAFMVTGYLLMSLFLNTDGSDSGEFNFYRGPVLPMTSLNGAEGMEVRRNVDFDFAPYRDSKQYSHTGTGTAEITDTYCMTNTTGESRMLELVYGFQGSFIDHPEEFPTIRVDGGIVQPELYPSVDPENLVWYAHNFEAYKKVLQEHDFLAIATAEPELADLPVKAYHFTDLAYNGGQVTAYPMLKVTYTQEGYESLWTNCVDVISTDEKEHTQTLLFRVDRGEAWIFTIGGELQDLTLGGNRDYNIREDSLSSGDSSLEGVEYRLEMFDTTLRSVLSRFAQEYDYWAVEGHDHDPNPGLVTPELLIDGAIKRMAQPDWVGKTTNVQSFQNLFDQVVTEVRMMYLVFPVELEPGQSVTVEASFIQEPSFDNSGPKHYREGYELATKLGSDLGFTHLSSSLSNTASIELGEQNFGFDLEKGITDVTLELSVERYYLEVRIRK